MNENNERGQSCCVGIEDIEIKNELSNPFAAAQDDERSFALPKQHRLTFDRGKSRRLFRDEPLPVEILHETVIRLNDRT